MSGETWGRAHERYLEPPDLGDCDCPDDCEDGVISGRDGDGRDIEQACPCAPCHSPREGVE